MGSPSQIIHAINRSTYKLDTSGVAGLFGGDYAVDALETIHLYEGRRFAGWYNYPGTVTVAKKFGRMANSRLWDSMFPGQNESPAITFRLAGKPGPEYNGSFSGTKLGTGYLGHLMAQECADSPCNPLQLFKRDNTEARKTGSAATFTVILLPPRQHERITETLTTTEVKGTKQEQFILINPKSKLDPPLALCAIAPSLVSILACVLCFLVHDFFCASLILFGIFSSGFSSLVLGAATLKIRVPVPSRASPVGDGLMFPESGNVIVLKGEEVDVNMVTKGEFELDYSAGILPTKKHHMIGFTSFLLCAQFLVQLLLIPLCTFSGQILFLISFVASGVYHLYVASYEREKVHRELLSQVLSVRKKKWTLGTRTQMAVFVCLVLGDGNQDPPQFKPGTILTRILPNVDETAVWGYWKKKVLKELKRFWDSASSVSYEPAIQVKPDAEDQAETTDYANFKEKDKVLLNDLIDDAWSVFNAYRRWRDRESQIWQGRSDAAEETESLRAHLLQGGSPA